MSQPFIAEVRIFGFNFPPRGWASCDGQLLQIAQNTALFSLVGTTYGGDGRTTFGLPDLRGRVPIHPGSGPGLTNRPWGSRGGSEETTLNANQLPSHDHALQASADGGSSPVPTDNVLAGIANGYRDAAGTLVSPLAGTVGTTGGGQAHNNMQPFLTVNFCIALTGVFPSRS